MDKTIELESEGVAITILDDIDTKPVPVYSRGIYFRNGLGLSLTDFVLNSRVTLEFIIRPESDGTLLSSTLPSDLNFVTFELENSSV